ncbi:hypothetical protein [Trinickia mobilis]|uniref:hypothetical protein n=1 Tax=Trinickia mobilis TaxID=2816356 RepID=UPI001A8C5F96|nr:hypothetical protein [Trinickia mobilis]
MPSSIASIGRMQASTVCQSLQHYRRTLPLNTMPRNRDDVCRGDGWQIGNERLSGDFELDPVFARQLIAGTVAAPEFGVTQIDPGSSWLHTYLYGSPKEAPGTLARLNEESQSVALGPGSVLSNVNTSVSAAHAAHAARIEKAIQAGAQRILSGASKGVRINSYITLYNGNTSGRGRPRPKIRIMSMPVEIVQPTLGTHFKYNTRMQTATEALKEVKLQKLAPKTSSLARAYARGGFGNGVLTFGPSAVLDLADSIRRDTKGALRFDARRFAIASARSQSGNLVGLGASAIATPLAVAFLGIAATGAPAILIGLGACFVAQIAWGVTGAPEEAEITAKRLMEK